MIINLISTISYPDWVAQYKKCKTRFWAVRIHVISHLFQFSEWLNSEFIPWNGKIFEFQKIFFAIWFGIQYYPYAEILGRLRAVCPKKSSKTWYRYRRPCIWEKSFKIELFTKNKSCSGFSMKNCWTVKFFVPRFSSTLEYRVF